MVTNERNISWDISLKTRNKRLTIRKAALNLSELVLVIRKLYGILPKILEKEKSKLKIRIYGEVFSSKDIRQFAVQLMHILYILQHF
jgi:hypothetical protein